jgi:hypothetical protein
MQAPPQVMRDIVYARGVSLCAGMILRANEQKPASC